MIRKMLKSQRSQVMRHSLVFLFFITLMASFSLCSAAGLPDKADGTAAPEKKEGFNAGDFVMDHVSDAYEWHILTVGHIHVSIPLPIILYSKNSGWHIFMSSRFHHGTESWKNFSIAGEGEHAGKIVELNERGEVINLPVDLSVTKVVFGIIFSVIILIWLFTGIARSAIRNKGKAPSCLQNVFEPVILFIRDEVAVPAIGEKKAEKYLPFLLTLFFFILINNLIGLIPVFPFGANVTGNIAVTMVLALFTFLITTFSGNKHYWKEIYNPAVPMWLKFPIPLMPIVELTGVITKPIVLMVRLFANMMAGHMIITVFVSLIFIFAHLLGPAAGAGVSVVSVIFSVFMILLDVLVSFIQAYVFTLLSALYFGMATEEHH
jgi:F-type H+-transporting ATPase subunit a